MKRITHERCLFNKGILMLVREFKRLTLAARIRQDIFFTMNLKNFKKYKG